MIDFIKHLFLFDSESGLAFNSWEFWVLFTLFLLVLGMVRKRKPVMVLYILAFSAFFYYKISGFFVILLFAKAIIDYLLGKLIAKSEGGARKATLLFSIILTAGILVYFKYTNFILDSFYTIMERNFQPLDIVVPVGISFVTFQTISYFVDIYKHKFDGARNVFEYLFYITFFPTIISGPIVRAVHLLPQVRSNRKITGAMVSSGFGLVISGLIKKAIIADYIAQYNNIVFSMGANYSGLEYLLALLGFALQIYYDFSGYSDMAIGLARIMGFRLLPNFKQPYKSRNITDFWRRWHMSLSFWLRDYIYIPLGGNRHGNLRKHLNLLITMLIGGIWHGAGLNFLIWGAIHGVGLILQKMLTPIKNPIKEKTGFLSVICTFAFVTFAWLFFRASSFEDATTIMHSIAFDFNPGMFIPFLEERTLWFVVFVISFIIIYLPTSLKQSVWRLYQQSGTIAKLILFMVVVQVIVQMSNVEVTQFIYSQF